MGVMNSSEYAITGMLASESIGNSGLGGKLSIRDRKR